MRIVVGAIVMCLCIGAAIRPSVALDRRPLVNVPIVSIAPALDGDSGWEDAVHQTIGWDLTHGQPSAEVTDVALVADRAALFVRFTVHQHAPVVSTQGVDNSGEGSDDNVTMRLFPSGDTGIEYYFRANPRGTHYQGSTENGNFAPDWISIGRLTPDGYVVTMRIPVRTMRSDGRATWPAQFERDIHVTSERDIWSHSAGMSSSDQVSYVGRLAGLGVLASSARAQPRIGFYGLAEAGSKATGGSTSRAGADLSVPVTATSSLVATIHPDFSNVEIDQQTISPTTFARSINEVRPFFAQGSRYYDNSTCYGCAGWSELYTPSIPTPKRGFQYEGTQGNITFGALDAVGDGRDDNAQSFTIRPTGNHVNLSYTRVASEQTLLHDVTHFASMSYNSQHGIVGYLETGAEAGSTVVDSRRARRFDGGIAYSTTDDFDAITTRSVGSQWNPADGFTAVNDVAGYSAQLNHTIHLKGGLQKVQLFEYVDHYAGNDGYGTNLYDTESQIGLFFRNQVSAQASLGTSFYRVPNDPQLHPSNVQGARFDYQMGTPVQSTLNLQAGRFGDGWLIAIDRIAGFRVMRHAAVSLEAYSTNWFGNFGHNVQWLERASVNFDVDRATTVTVGLRKTIGIAPPFPGQTVPTFLYATNVSVALARRRARSDFFLVYGDASALVTRPALTLKYVKYIGADKGT